jgi:hypothetical protein
MAFIDHGTWQAYVPATLPIGAPSGALFVRRDSDGVDWYDYVKAGSNFTAGSVKFTALWQDLYSSYVCKVATFDETMLFPTGQMVREITGYGGSDPQADFGQKLYDPATDTFSDIPYPVWPPRAANDLEARVAALEAKAGGK